MRAPAHSPPPHPAPRTPPSHTQRVETPTLTFPDTFSLQKAFASSERDGVRVLDLRAVEGFGAAAAAASALTRRPVIEDLRQRRFPLRDDNEAARARRAVNHHMIEDARARSPASHDSSAPSTRAAEDGRDELFSDNRATGMIGDRHARPSGSRTAAPSPKAQGDDLFAIGDDVGDLSPHVGEREKKGWWSLILFCAATASSRSPPSSFLLLPSPPPFSSSPLLLPFPPVRSCSPFLLPAPPPPPSKSSTPQLPGSRRSVSP